MDYSNKSILEVFEEINNNDNCLFVAYISNNFDYLSVNAFAHKIHCEITSSCFSGVIINLRSDANVGHSFADDSYRFPAYCSVELVHLSDNQGRIDRRIRDIVGIVSKIMRRKNNDKNPLYLLSPLDGPCIKRVFNTIRCCKRDVKWVATGNGKYLESRIKTARMMAFETVKMIAARVLTKGVIRFQPFDQFCKRLPAEKYFIEATQDEKLGLMGQDEHDNYILYVSQGTMTDGYYELVKDVLNKERNKGYTVYIKPHNYERDSLYLKDEEFIVLPYGYAIESIVAGARRKPDKILGFFSSSFFSCSAWFDVPVYSLIGLIPREEWGSHGKAFSRYIQSKQYPRFFLYK